MLVVPEANWKFYFSFLAVCILVSFELNAAEKEEVLLIGRFSWQEWQASAGWKEYDAPDYKLDDTAVDSIRSILNKSNFQFKLFSGSWCSDSESEVPKLIKLLKVAGLTDSNLVLFGVDRDKKEPSGEAESLDVQKVPTLIVFQHAREIARIIEFPETSWEQNILKILQFIK